MKNRKFFIMVLIIVLAMLVTLGITFVFAGTAESLDLGWQQVNSSGFGEPLNVGVTSLEEFNGQLYAGSANWNEGGQVWRSEEGTSWTPVSDVRFGDTDPNTNLVIIDLFEFNGQLYAGTGWGPDEAVGQIWRSSDGTTWDPVISDGFGDANNWSISTFSIFSDTLYAATGNDVTGFQVWRSETGDSLSWTNVVTAGLGYPTNASVTGFYEFNNALYAAIESNLVFDPAQVWRSETGDSLSWTPVTTNGFNDTDNYSTGGFASFNGYLYLGTRNDDTGAQLFRSNDGTTWMPVISDGFGDSNNVKIESLFTGEDFLYAITYNEVTGMEVWNTDDGTTWKQVNLDGFSNSNNVATLWSNASVIFDDSIYVGTWNNVDGGQIWMNLIGITGTVTAIGGEPQSGLWVQACLFDDENTCDYGWTDADGSYSIIPLPAENYRVMVEQRDGWRREYYDDTPYWDEATAVTANLGKSTTGIDFVLEPGGTISGWVRDANGDPITDEIHVAACDYDDNSRCWWSFDQSAVDGSFTIPGMAAGQYRVRAYSFGDYWIAEFYNDTVDYEQANAVQVTEGITTTDINFELELGGAITGTVTAIGGEPQSGLYVEACVFDEEGPCYYDWTETDGSYSIISLPVEDYRVMVEQNDGWRREYYDDTPYMDEAAPVTVNAGESTPGIDFILEPGGTISGWVLDVNGDPITDEIHVAACDYNDNSRCWWSFDQSDVDGSFTISGMATGQYRVSAYSFGDYWISEFYSDTVDYEQATAVQVTEGITTTDINFELAYRRYIYLPLVQK